MDVGLHNKRRQPNKNIVGLNPDGTYKLLDKGNTTTGSGGDATATEARPAGATKGVRRGGGGGREGNAAPPRYTEAMGTQVPPPPPPTGHAATSAGVWSPQANTAEELSSEVEFDDDEEQQQQQQSRAPPPPPAVGGKGGAPPPPPSAARLAPLRRPVGGLPSVGGSPFGGGALPSLKPAPLPALGGQQQQQPGAPRPLPMREKSVFVHGAKSNLANQANMHQR